ncbi:MAG: hypothetical protein ACREMN_14755, partial [Gemmatimonadales bacterium]
PPPPPPPLPPPPTAAPAPPVLIPSAEPRRTPTQFRLLEDEPVRPPAPKRRRKRRGALGRLLTRLAVLVLIVGGLGGAYWYFVMREGAPGTAWPQQAAALIARLKARITASAPASAPPAPPAAPARRPETPFARFDRLSDSLARAVRSYQERATLFASGRIDCAELWRSLVAVENVWNVYSTERRARLARGSFDPRRAARDQTLYASVDGVETQFERSRCRRL